jgi:hypothetical protein
MVSSIQFILLCLLYLPCLNSFLIRQYSNKFDLRKSVSYRIFLKESDEDNFITQYDNDLQPKFQLKSLDQLESEQRKQSRSSKGVSKKVSTTSTNLQSSRVFNSMSFEELYRRSGGKPKSNEIKPVKDDLNGIEPWKPLVFSIFPAGFSFLAFQASFYLASHFAVNLVVSEVYPIQRAAIIARNLVVGIVTLAAGFSGVVAVGLFALGIAVVVGVIKGEVDPKKDVAISNDSID